MTPPVESWREREGELEHIGIHLAPLQVHHERIDWAPARPRADRMRVKHYTCGCEPVFYEFCLAGGLTFIRRLRRKGRRMVVHESPWVLTAPGRALWESLLNGTAR